MSVPGPDVKSCAASETWKFYSEFSYPISDPSFGETEESSVLVVELDKIDWQQYLRTEEFSQIEAQEDGFCLSPALEYKLKKALDPRYRPIDPQNIYSSSAHYFLKQTSSLCEHQKVSWIDPTNPQYQSLSLYLSLDEFHLFKQLTGDCIKAASFLGLQAPEVTSEDSRKPILRPLMVRKKWIDLNPAIFLSLLEALSKREELSVEERIRLMSISGVLEEVPFEVLLPFIDHNEAEFYPIPQACGLTKMQGCVEAPSFTLNSEGLWGGLVEASWKAATEGPYYESFSLGLFSVEMETLNKYATFEGDLSAILLSSEVQEGPLYSVLVKAHLGTLEKILAFLRQEKVKLQNQSEDPNAPLRERRIDDLIRAFEQKFQEIKEKDPLHNIRYLAFPLQVPIMLTFLPILALGGKRLLQKIFSKSTQPSSQKAEFSPLRERTLNFMTWGELAYEVGYHHFLKPVWNGFVTLNEKFPETSVYTPQPLPETPWYEINFSRWEQESQFALEVGGAILLGLAARASGLGLALESSAAGMGILAPLPGEVYDEQMI